jgi:hypothetical protein
MDEPVTTTTSGGVPVTNFPVPESLGTGTFAVTNAGQPLDVLITGQPLNVLIQGTLPVVFNVAGTVTATIGDVELIDTTGNFGTIPAAGLSKAAFTPALVVQHIDDSGTPLRESTQASIELNAYAAVAYLAEIAANQGTESSQALAAIADNQRVFAQSAKAGDVIISAFDGVAGYGRIVGCVQIVLRVHVLGFAYGPCSADAFRRKNGKLKRTLQNAVRGCFARLPLG